MTIYARIEADGRITVHDGVMAALISDELVAKWVAENNAKAQTTRPFVVDAQPTPNATQVVVDAGYVIEPTQVRQTWALRDKTAEELEAEALATEKAQLAADIAAINVQLDVTNALYNAMTNAQKLDTLRDDRRLVLKAVKYLLRQAKRSF